MNTFEDACEKLGENAPRKPSREEILQSEIKSLKDERDSLIEQVKQLRKANDAATKRNDQLQQRVDDQVREVSDLRLRIATSSSSNPYANRSMHSSR